jgi:tRNA (guanine-N7-)-methyltransferase
MRKAARLWRNEAARTAAASAMYICRADYFTVEPRELFVGDAPLELEIGAGRGDFILERATAMPDHNFIAVELARPIAQLMAVRVGRRGLTNLRVVHMDARPLIHLMLPAGSLSACHIYFPDPWPKERHIKHRLFTPVFANGIRRVLARDAPLFVATDVRDYADAIFPMLEACGFARAALAVPGASQTGFARKFIGAGREIYAAAFVALRTGRNEQ